MVLCDSNFWLALALSRHVHHAAARDWLAAGLRPCGNPPLTNRQAWTAYESLAADDRIVPRADEPAGLERTSGFSD